MVNVLLAVQYLILYVSFKFAYSIELLEKEAMGFEVESLSSLAKIEYSLDFSFPVHHLKSEGKHNSHHFNRYKTFLETCFSKHGSGKCTLSENYRRYLNLHVPKNKVNYTDTGFLKLKAPTVVFEALYDLFHANKHKAVKENWSHGKTLLNHWDSHPYIINWER